MKRAMIFVMVASVCGQLCACNGPVDYTALFRSMQDAEESKRLKASNDQRLIEQFNLLRTLQNEKCKKDCRIKVICWCSQDRDEEE